MPECKHRYETDVGEKLCQKKLQFDNDSAECIYVVGEEEACIEFDPANLVEYHDRAYAEGQQNPDPKQYANREELVVAIMREKGRPTPVRYENEKILAILEIIRTHGLEESP